MSLLEGMLGWDMLENMGVGGPPTEVWLAIRDDGATGSGLEADPYNCNLPAYPNSDNPSPGFDYVMNFLAAKYPSTPLTIRLQPGTYYTLGSNAWNPKSGWRIAGCGRVMTQVSSADGNVGGGTAYLIGISSSATLTGFELFDVSLRNYPLDSGLYGGVDVTGCNIRVEGVWVVSFGASASGGAVYGISAARASATSQPYNCVIASCSVASPDTYPLGDPNPTQPYAQPVWQNLATVVGLSIRSTAAGNYHTACAIRDCYANAGYNGTNIIGITAGGGNVSRAEGSRTVFGSEGGPTVGAAFGEVATGELRAWCNYSTNVQVWATGNATLASTISLLQLSNNVIDLNSGFGTQAIAFASGSNISFTSAVLLNNVSRRFGTANAADIGFEISGATNLSVGDNMAQVPAGSDGRYSVGIVDGAPHATFLGNRTPTLQLLRGYDPATTLLAEELYTKAEEMCLGI